MSEARRREIVELILAADRPVTGTELANHFGVSRQIIVQDMAILRAAGGEIVATPRGYRMPTARSGSSRFREVLAVQHGRELIEAELTALIDAGVHVVDVIIEHPIYGELRGLLMVESPADVRAFLERLEDTEPLSALTRGVHLHTVEAARPDQIEAAKAALRRLGILLEEPARRAG